MTKEQIDELREDYNLINIKFQNAVMTMIECINFYPLGANIHDIIKKEKFGEIEYLENKIKVITKLKC